MPVIGVKGMGVISLKSIKYLLDVLCCVLTLVYLLINVVDIPLCLTGVQVSSVIFLVIEALSSFLTVNKDTVLAEKSSWRVSLFLCCVEGYFFVILAIYN